MRSSKTILKFAGFALIVSLGSCNTPDSKKTETTQDQTMTANLKEETVSYNADTVNMKGYVVYDSSKQGKRPAVLVVPEWWGLNDYPKMRARKLAELGYIAMAVDMYGNGKIADNPTDAGNLAKPFYSDMGMAKSRFDAALNKLKTYDQVDTNNIAAIGYCFGGAQVLNMARLGDNLKAVVSFHGNLIGAPADKKLLKADILVCHGEADQFVKPEEVAAFKKQMDSIGANYSFKQYPNATHAFTNPNATAMGEKFNMPIRYNGAADTASWNDMKAFFGKTLK
jgi:dienelactone hydrolase